MERIYERKGRLLGERGVWEREGAWFSEGYQEGEYMLGKRTSLLKSRLHYNTDLRDGWPSFGMNSGKCTPVTYPLESLLVNSKPRSSCSVPKLWNYPSSISISQTHIQLVLNLYWLYLGKKSRPMTISHHLH